jgi:hypothetical protein
VCSSDLIRSYMRVGLGYLNTWIGMIGFAVGYLPFTMNYKATNGLFFLRLR